MKANWRAIGEGKPANIVPEADGLRDLSEDAKVVYPPQLSRSFKIPPFPRGLAEVGGPSLWGGVLEGEVAEVLDGFEVGVAGQIADAAVEVESELGGEGGGVDRDGELRQDGLGLRDCSSSVSL